MVARGQRGAHQPGRGRGLAQQQAAPGRKNGGDGPDLVQGGGRSLAHLGHLGLGERGLGAGVAVGKCVARTERFAT